MSTKEIILVALVALFLAVMPTCSWETDVTEQEEAMWYESNS